MATSRKISFCIAHSEAPDVRIQLVLQDDELDFAEQQKQAAIQHRQQWEHDSAEKQRLLKMQEDHHQFQQQIVSRRQGEFEELQVPTRASHKAVVLLITLP